MSQATSKAACALPALSRSHESDGGLDMHVVTSPALRGAVAAPLHGLCSPSAANLELLGDGKAYNNDKDARVKSHLFPSTATVRVMICILVLLGALAWSVAGNQASAAALADGVASPWAGTQGARAQHPTLVIYVYSATECGC